jgi:hypothetical protein
MLYGSRLRGYAPYAHGLWSGLVEWIILRMTRKRKLANCLSYSEYLKFFHIIYYSLYMLIMQVYHDSGCIHGFGHMPYSGQKIWLRSYILTSVDVTTLDVSPDSGYASNSGQWVRRLSYHLSYERLCMAGLDVYSILQLGHLVRNRLGGTHDSISVQNLISHSFTCMSSQTMCRGTKEHLACDDMRKVQVSGGTRYPTTLED